MPFIILSLASSMSPLYSSSARRHVEVPVSILPHCSAHVHLLFLNATLFYLFPFSMTLLEVVYASCSCFLPLKYSASALWKSLSQRFPLTSSSSNYKDFRLPLGSLPSQPHSAVLTSSFCLDSFAPLVFKLLRPCCPASWFFPPWFFLL